MNQLITHIDMDGAGAEFVRRTISQGINTWLPTKFMDHEDIKKLIIDDSITYWFVDIIPPVDILRKLSNKSFIICDHHKTAQATITEAFGDKIPPDAKIYIDTNVCATKLFAQKFGPQSSIAAGMAERLDYKHFLYMVELINDWDMWIHKYPDSKRLNALFTFWGAWRFVAEIMFEKFNPTYHLSLADELIKFEEREIEEVCKKENIVEFEFEGEKGAKVFSLKYSSQIGHRLKNSGYQIAMVINPIRGTVSLYSPDDKSGVDVSELAKQRGGGGHYCASGFPIKKITLDDYSL